VHGPYQLKQNPNTTEEALARFTPRRRGLCRITRMRAKTSYPFGFFEKSRRLTPSRELCFWVAPRAVDIQALLLPLLAELGEEPAGRAGRGEDFFALRPLRPGDDPRLVHWKKSAKLGRFVLRETEAQSARELWLELVLSPDTLADEPWTEHCIAALGSVCEDLLARDFKVGVCGPGTLVPAGMGGRQRYAILQALAKLQPLAPTVVPALRPGAVLLRVGALGSAPQLHLGVPRPRDDAVDAGTTGVAA
jgi:uncharacterized protein (DUF58 family)